ncbi:MAG: NTP transferase domain-containing protein, partial [Chloroflexi bacterium]|nr:NTP transferase domain-containing protein [Chloroflexota bacterium]
MTTPPSSSGPAGRRTAAVILAAGLGTRMRSRVPKVLHPLCGRPMLAYVLDAWEQLVADEAPADGRRASQAILVYSPATEAIREVVGNRALMALQASPRGTGDAVAAALAAVPDDVDEILVLSGDVPLVEPGQLHAVLEQRRLDDAAIALASVFAADPAELGRVVRGEFGTVERIVEARDASPDDLETNEINAGLYAFDAAWLRRRIADLRPSASNGELYVTDLVAMAREDGRIVSAVGFDDDGTFDGINDRGQLAQAEWAMRVRINERHMRAGVTMRDPSTA